MRPEFGFRSVRNLQEYSKSDNSITIFGMTSSSNFFNVLVFPFTSLVTGPSFMSMSSLVLELLKFSFIRD